MQKGDQMFDDSSQTSGEASEASSGQEMERPVSAAAILIKILIDWSYESHEAGQPSAKHCNQA